MAYQATLNYTDLPRSGLALGGIGTGSMELRADGIFHQWSIFNNFPLGTGSPLPYDTGSLLFFLLRYQQSGRPPRIKLLQIDTGHFAGGITNPIYEFPWMSGIQRIEYQASFPFATLTFTDAEMPLVVTMEAFSPFIPHDVKNSALPAVLFNFKIKALSEVDVLLVATLRNAVGYDVLDKVFRTTLLREAEQGGVFMTCDGMTGQESSYGSQALYSYAPDTSYYLGWGHRHPFYERLLANPHLINIDDTANRNSPPPGFETPRAGEYLYSSLGITRTLTADIQLEHSFATTWHFPNLYNDSPRKGVPGERLEGHYYSNFFQNAAAVGTYLAEQRPDLEARTRQFHQHFYDSTIAPLVLDQINSHLNTFITSTWLTQAGAFGIQEGITPAMDWGPLATIDVALYGSLATAALFPELDRAMLLAHQAVQKPNGAISHGIPRDFTQFEKWDRHGGRVDLPAQYVLLALRHYFWTHDHAYLQASWESIKKALDYARDELDFDGDGIPDMHGMGSSYDNFAMWGTSAYVGSIWLAALQHAIPAAQAIGDTEARIAYEATLVKAQTSFEARLWNGQYYRLFNDQGGRHGGRDEGCMTDQLIGQWLNYQSSLGDLVAPERRQQVLRYISTHAFEAGMGLRNCIWSGDTSYLHEVSADTWFDQANTYWSGVELAFAALLIYEGLVNEAIQLIQTVDTRYRKAGRYFDHQEWGGHYYRAMAAWGLLNALAGLQLREGCYTFAPRLPDDQVKLFLAFPGATVHYYHHLSAGCLSLTVLTGTLTAQELLFKLPFTHIIRAEAGDKPLAITPTQTGVLIAEPVTLVAGEMINLHWQ